MMTSGSFTAHVLLYNIQPVELWTTTVSSINKAAHIFSGLPLLSKSPNGFQALPPRV